MQSKAIKKYAPTEAVKNNNSRASALIEKYNKKIEVNSFEELSLEEVKKLYTELQVLEKQSNFKSRTQDGCLNTKTLEFLSKGGTAGLAWTRLILKEQGILKSYQKEIKPEEINTEDTLAVEHLPIIKSADEELKQVTYVAMVPDLTDAHGDVTSVDEVRKAKESFNKALMANQKLSNLFHLYETNTFSVIESYLAPCDMVLNGHFVSKSTWLMTLQVHDDGLWEMVKSGEVVGLSIGALARVENLDEE